MEKNLPISAGDAGNTGLSPGSGRSGEGNGNPLQYSCRGKSHGQRSLVGYSSWSRRRVGHDFKTKAATAIDGETSTERLRHLPKYTTVIGRPDF